MRVDFYVLGDSAQPDNPHGNEHYHFACRLIEKAYLRKHRVYVHCHNEQQAHTVDELLWCFKEDSFIPHNLCGEGPQPPPPVQLGFGDKPAQFNDLLINLSDGVPEFFAQFKRVIEIVSANDTSRNLSREHFKFYRQQGLIPHTHKL